MGAALPAHLLEVTFDSRYVAVDDWTTMQRYVWLRPALERVVLTSEMLERVKRSLEG